MPTKCEQKLINFKKGQAERTSALFEDLSFKVSRALYGMSKTWQKQAIAQRLVDRRITEFKNNIYKQLETDIRHAFNLSDLCGDKRIEEYTKGLYMSREQKEVLFARNLSAVSSFMSRKTNGFTLSDRVWNLGESTKGQINSFIEGGLLSGKSAVRNAKDLKQFLKEPDKQFRRVRALNPATGKRTGKLILSNPAKNYHPGQGVYRSSYKNALRLSRNEVNMAYKTADIERYRRLPFVKGYEVHLSNSHPIYDVCDELAGKYPKNFTFTGWHPNCICFVTPVQISKKDFKKYLKTGKVDPGNYITDTPKGLGEWINNNSNRIKGWKSKPYFITENFKATKDGFKLLPGIGVVPPLVPPVPKVIPTKPRITPPIPRVIPKPKPKSIPKKEVKPKIVPKESYPEFTPFNTHKEGKEYFKNLIEKIEGGKFKVSQISQNRDLTLVDMSAKMKQLTRLLHDYKISNNMSPSRMKISFQAKGSTLGYVEKGFRRDYSSIWYKEFNVGGGKEMTSQITKRALDKSFGSKVDLKLNNLGTVTHEFTHFVTTSKNVYFKGASLKEIKFWKEVVKLRNEYRTEVRKAKGYFSKGSSYGTFPKNDDRLTEIWLGRYAQTNADEFLAEGFKEYKLNSNPSPYALKIGKLFDKFWKK